VAWVGCVHIYVWVMLGGVGWGCESMLKAKLRSQVGSEKRRGTDFCCLFFYFFLSISTVAKATATITAMAAPTIVMV
jgi:hypothetical protein